MVLQSPLLLTALALNLVYVNALFKKKSQVGSFQGVPTLYSLSPGSFCVCFLTLEVIYDLCKLELDFSCKKEEEKIFNIV